MMKTIFAILTVISVTLVACQMQPSSGLHARNQAHLLKQGMPEAEVVSLIGNPDKISLRTCGTDTDAPWTCRIHEYTGYTASVTIFTVYYYEFLDGWYLNHFITH